MTLCCNGVVLHILKGTKQFFKGGQNYLVGPMKACCLQLYVLLSEFCSVVVVVCLFKWCCVECCYVVASSVINGATPSIYLNVFTYLSLHNVSTMTSSIL